MTVPEQAVQEISAETNKVVQAANTVVVDGQEGLQEATDILSWIAKAKKQIEEKRRFFVKPLQEQITNINSLFKGYMAPLEQANKTLRGKILAYRQEQERKLREEEERLRKLQEKEQKRLERIAKKQGVAPPPPPVMPIEVKVLAQTVRSNMGTVSARKVWDFEIIDPDKVPNEYKIINEKAIRAAVKAGVRSLPGVRIFQREELSVRTM